MVNALRRSDVLAVFAPAGVAAHLREEAPQAAVRIHTVEPGSSFDAAGFDARSFGGQHALIHPQVPIVANIGYLVDGNVYDPGDLLHHPGRSQRADAAGPAPRAVE